MEGFDLAELPPAFAGVQNYSPNNLIAAVDMTCKILGKKGVLKTTASTTPPKVQNNAPQRAVAPPMNVQNFAPQRSVAVPMNVPPRANVPSIQTPYYAPQQQVNPRFKQPLNSVPMRLNLRVRDTYFFGRYPQSGSQSEPIAWRVLTVKNGMAMLISQMLLDCVKYNETSRDVTWENYTLRKWLTNILKTRCLTPMS